MGLRGGVRDCFSTVSTTVHQSLNAVSRVKSGIMLQHGHRLRSLCNRIYYGASTHVPLHAQRLLRFASDLDGDMLTARDHVAVKTAMKKEQVRENARIRRPIARAASGDCKMSSYTTLPLIKFKTSVIRYVRGENIESTAYM